MNEQSALRALRLFNAKAEKLDGLSFVARVFGHPIGFRLQADRAGFLVSRRGPGAESIDALCLTIRFFVQDRDQSSFRALSRVYAFLGEQGVVDQASVAEFETARVAIEELKRSTPYIPPFEGKTHTPWEIFDTILNGELAHANEEKAQLYQRWKSRPEVLLVMEHWFVKTLAALITIIDRVRPINERAIVSLKAKQSSVPSQVPPLANDVTDAC